MGSKTADFDPDQYFQSLTINATEHYQKGRLATLKRWFRDLIEMQVATHDTKFNAYLRARTNYDIDIFQHFFQRIVKIITKGKITTDAQYYDVKLLMEDGDISRTFDTGKLLLFETILNKYRLEKECKKNYR